MSTVRELFAMLREDVEKDAIEETRKEWCDDFENEMNVQVKDLPSAIKCMFNWSKSPQGNDYWNNIAHNPPLKTDSND